MHRHHRKPQASIGISTASGRKELIVEGGVLSSPHQPLSHASRITNEYPGSMCCVGVSQPRHWDIEASDACLSVLEENCSVLDPMASLASALFLSK